MHAPNEVRCRVRLTPPTLLPKGDKWMIGDAFLGGPVTVPPAEGEKGTPAAWHQAQPRPSIRTTSPHRHPTLPPTLQYRWVDFVTGLKYGVATVETGLDVSRIHPTGPRRLCRASYIAAT